MSLVQLVYISEPIGDMQSSLSEFIPLAQEKNKQFSITGLILSGKDFYLQVIEGEKENINQLYRNIVRDERHRHCTLLRYTETAFRDFADWSMTHTTLEELHNSYLDVIVAPGELTYRKLTGIRAMALLRRISAHLQYIEKK